MTDIPEVMFDVELGQWKGYRLGTVMSRPWDPLNPHQSFEHAVLDRLVRIESMLDHILRWIENAEADRHEQHD